MADCMPLSAGLDLSTGDVWDRILQASRIDETTPRPDIRAELERHLRNGVMLIGEEWAAGQRSASARKRPRVKEKLVGGKRVRDRADLLAMAFRDAAAAVADWDEENGRRLENHIYRRLRECLSFFREEDRDEHGAPPPLTPFPRNHEDQREFLLRFVDAISQAVEDEKAYRVRVGEPSQILTPKQLLASRIVRLWTYLHRGNNPTITNKTDYGHGVGGAMVVFARSISQPLLASTGDKKELTYWLREAQREIRSDAGFLDEVRCVWERLNQLQACPHSDGI